MAVRPAIVRLLTEVGLDVRLLTALDARLLTVKVINARLGDRQMLLHRLLSIDGLEFRL